MNKDTLLFTSYGLQGFISLGSSIAQASAIRAQGRYQSSMYNLNAKMAEFQGEQALKRGERSAIDYEKQVAQLIGTQRTAIAANNVQLGEGSAAEILTDTAVRGAENVVTIRSNAWQEAWGFRAQAAEYRGAGNMAEIGSDFDATQTVLSGFTHATNYVVRAANVAGGMKAPQLDKLTPIKNNKSGGYQSPWGLGGGR